MASSTEAGLIRVYLESPDGRRVLTHQYRNDGPISAGGSPDGVLANKTADKQLFVPKHNQVATGGWKVKMTIQLDSSDGIDQSDCVINWPLTVRGAGVRYLDASDLGFTADLPASSPAGVELPLGSGYTIPNGEYVKNGGALGVISIEDDTA